MILRALAVLTGLCCGAGLAQFPEYAQQYTQRLGGAVDEIARVVADFDRSAAATGLTREAALSQMTGNALQERLASDMRFNIARSEQLSSDYEALAGASTLKRLTLLPKLTDPSIAARALEGFEPAIKLDLEGIGFALVGYFAGFGFVRGLGRGVRAISPKAARPSS
ncbi:MAG: DUF2937 family protein [Pseudomonadota bacterium]